MNGFELAIQARRLQPTLKTLFITGHLEEITYGQTAADPKADILFKPFNLSDFAKRVSNLLEDLPCHKIRTA